MYKCTMYTNFIKHKIDVLLILFTTRLWVDKLPNTIVISFDLNLELTFSNYKRFTI